MAENQSPNVAIPTPRSFQEHQDYIIILQDNIIKLQDDLIKPLKGLLVANAAAKAMSRGIRWELDRLRVEKET